VKINVFNKQKNLSISNAAVKKIVSAVLALEGHTCDEISVSFVTTRVISQMHADYFNDPTTTDCISFPMDDLESIIDYRILGEIFVCPQTAIDYAKKHQKDPLEECTLYVVHGLLHLMGYDDLQPKDRSLMRKAEKKHMLNLKNSHLLLCPKKIS